MDVCTSVHYANALLLLLLLYYYYYCYYYYYYYYYLSRKGFNMALVCSDPGPNVYNVLYRMETELYFHFRSCLANFISGMRTIKSLDNLAVFEREKHSTRPSFRVLALNPVVFGSQLDFF